MCLTLEFNLEKRRLDADRALCVFSHSSNVTVGTNKFYRRNCQRGGKFQSKMGKKKQTVLETAILLTLITGAMFPVTGQATNRNVAQIGVDNAGKLITVGTETQWEPEWNAIAKAPTSLKPFGVGYNQVDTSTSPTGLSVYADTVKIESTQAPRQSYGLSLNDTNPKGKLLLPKIIP